jgi:mRNA-degrading endonuclease RelE of RelBE toxin-antitoxin system
MFQLFIKPSAVRESRKIPKKDKEKLRKRIEELKEEPKPHGVKKLRGQGGFYQFYQFFIARRPIDETAFIEIG